MQFKLYVATDYKYRGTPVINYHPSFNMKIEGPLHSRLRPGTLKPLRANQVRDIQFLADYYTHLLLRPGTHRPLQANPVKDLTLILLIKALTLTSSGTSPVRDAQPLAGQPNQGIPLTSCPLQATIRSSSDVTTTRRSPLGCFPQWLLRQFGEQ